MSATSEAELRLPVPFEKPVSLGGGGGEILMRLPGKMSRISKNFHRSKQEVLKVLFEKLKMQKNLKNIGPYTESTDFIFNAFKKIIHLVALFL